MKIKLKDMVSNRFRDFTIYPIDDDQVQRLSQSMGERGEDGGLGFFSGVTVRPNPDGRGYELAAGHHRAEAARRVGLTEIEAVVNDYSDDEMVDIMTIENLTQRGNNAAAQTDSVAAYARIVTKAILLGDNTAKFLAVSDGDERHLSRAQTMIAEHGPGKEIIYRAINRFDRKDRGGNKHAEIVTSTAIEASLASLKQGGVMGKIVSDALKEVKAIRAERDEAARVAEEKRRAAEEKAEAARAKAEAAAKADAERRDREAQAAAKAAAEAKERAKAADGARKAAADKAAREAEERRKQAEKDRAEAAKQAEKDAETRRSEREAAAKADAKRKAAAESEREHRRKEAEAVKAQRELDKVYDPRCIHVFRLPSHEAVFRKGVLSESGRRFIPVAAQYALAKDIRGKIDAIEKKRGMDLGSNTIMGLVSDEITAAMGMQKQIDREEKDRLLRDSAVTRVRERWTTIRRGLNQAESALTKLVEEQEAWSWPTPFPLDNDAIRQMGQMLHRFNELKKRLGL